MKIRNNIQTVYQSNIADYIADTGVADAYVVTIPIAITSYTSGLQIVFMAANTNVGASTINANGLGAKTIKKRVTDDLGPGDIIAGQIVVISYDGTNFQLQSAISGFSGYSGRSGYSGYSGYSGISGYSGYSGISGYSGYSGISGYSGFSGLSGYSGFSGVSGYSGFSGVSGYSGYSGTGGGAGSSGFSGYSGAASTSAVNITPVTVNTNTTGDQNLMSYTVAAGALNTVLKTLRVFGAGVFTINTTATFTLKIKLGALTLASFATASITAVQTSCPFNFDFCITDASTGATGTVESHGTSHIKLTGGAGLGGPYMDANVAVSSAIDLTASQTLQIAVAFSANAAGGNVNSASQRQMTVEIFN